MRRPNPCPLILTAVILSCPAEGDSSERTAFAFRATDDTLVEISLPPDLVGPPGGVTYTHVGNGWSPWASTQDPLGRILSINSPSDPVLVAYSPFSGHMEELCVFSQGFPPDYDLTFGPNSELLLALFTIGESELFVVDPEDCGLTARGTIFSSFGTIEYHQGAFFGGGNGLHRVDPQTFQVTTLVPYSPWGDYWGLASDGDNLWYLWSGSVSGGPTTTSIGVVDPATGDSLWSTVVPSQHYEEWFTILEVVEQAAPPVPTLLPGGLVAMAILVGAAGFLKSRM